jgi:alginate O-acetyltransferase complex protein AlgI
VGWVLFYYESLGDGIRHLGIMFGGTGAKLTDATVIYYFKHYLVFLAAAVLACVPWKSAVRLPGAEKWSPLIKPLVITALFLLALCMIVTQSYNPFLYFRF